MANKYPSDWASRAKKVKKRDNYMCQNCGSLGGSRGTAQLEAHHVVPKSKGGTHNLTNLITICEECHNAIHGNRAAPTKSGPSNKTKSTEFPDYTNNLVSVFKYLASYNYVRINEYSVFNLHFMIAERFDKTARSLFDVSHDVDHPPKRLIRKYEILKNILGYRTVGEDTVNEKEDLENYLEVIRSEDTQDIESFLEAERIEGDLGTLNELALKLKNIPEENSPKHFSEFISNTEFIIEQTERVISKYEDIIKINEGRVELEYDSADQWEMNESINGLSNAHNEWQKSLQTVVNYIE